jgi:hypothetical protein
MEKEGKSLVFRCDPRKLREKCKAQLFRRLGFVTFGG